MSNRMTIKTCEFCGKTYEAKKCDSLYCTPTCRKYAYLGREKRSVGGEVPATYTPYDVKKEKIPDNPPFGNELMMDLMTIITQELINALKQAGLK